MVLLTSANSFANPANASGTVHDSEKDKRQDTISMHSRYLVPFSAEKPVVCLFLSSCLTFSDGRVVRCGREGARAG